MKIGLAVSDFTWQAGPERIGPTFGRIARDADRADASPFEGRNYQLERPLNSPNSLRRPHPPIMIGGGGERKTLRLVARYGDACNLFEFGGIDHAIVEPPGQDREGSLDRLAEVVPVVAELSPPGAELAPSPSGEVR